MNDLHDFPMPLSGNFYLMTGPGGLPVISGTHTNTVAYLNAANARFADSKQKQVYTKAARISQGSFVINANGPANPSPTKMAVPPNFHLLGSHNPYSMTSTLQTECGEKPVNTPDIGYFEQDPFAFRLGSTSTPKTQSMLVETGEKELILTIFQQTIETLNGIRLEIIY